MWRQKSMIDEVIFTEQTFFSYRLKKFLLFLLNIAKWILSLLWKIVLIPVKIARRIFSYIYINVHDKMNTYKKKSIKWLIIIGVIDAVVIVALYYILDHLYISAIFGYLILIASDIALYYLIKLYGFLIGDEDECEALAQATEEYVEDFSPSIAKIHGETGAGKDEAAAGFAVIKARQFKRLMQEEMNLIEKKAYIFNFTAILNCACINAHKFFSSSEEITKNEFVPLFRSNQGFLKPYYQKRIDIEDFIEDAKEFHKDPINSVSEWAYRVGIVNQKHYMDLAYDYLMLYIRLNVEQNVIWSNQPFIENVDENLTAKIFSMDYLVTRKRKNEIVKNEKTNENEIYEEKVLYPFKDYNIFFETECGTWYMNLDQTTKNQIIELGIRDFKAFNRHFMPHFVYYAVDQDPNRMFKVLKELDHSYIRIDSREVFDGGNFVNKFIEVKILFLNFFINRRMKKHILRNGESKIDKYKTYYRYTSKEKYKSKVKDLQKILNMDLDDKLECLISKRAKLLEQIEYNKYYYGYIKKDITVSRAPVEGDADAVSVIKKLKEFKNDFKQKRKTYSISICLRKRDAWRYDTHYMKAAKEYRAKHSELNMIKAPNWTPNLLMNKKSIDLMGYNAANAMFGISDIESIKLHYKLSNSKAVNN